ncbi:MAG: ABC transporter ATP-binding protein [Desulfobacterales bacterium]
MNAQNQKEKNSNVLMRIDSVSKAFGGVQALWDISFDLQSGLIHGLIGPNGAGKTTLFNLITGIYRPDQGQIMFDGQYIQGRQVHQLVALGIARTFQNVEIFGSMSVIENVMVGQHVRTKSGFWGAVTRVPWMIREEKKTQDKAIEILRFVGIEHLAYHKSSELPFGWQRLLEIARALASNPKVLLLDEPAAGLNATETRTLGKLLKKIQDGGTTILLVEHDMSLTMEISDKIMVLDQGRKLAEGTPREIQSNVSVMAAYLGGGVNHVKD